MSLQDTPRAGRLHIGLFGRRNSGKSSLVNALTGQQAAVVSPVAGTTTDPVYKAMEVHGIGPCVFMDTAGFDDEGELGALRVEKTRDALNKTDIALVLFSQEDSRLEQEWIQECQRRKIPVLAVLNKTDTLKNPKQRAEQLRLATGLVPLMASAKTGEGVSAIREAIIRLLPADYGAQSITGNLCQEGDSVLLVMPQDIQAPKGRLILPQVQTIRELLDKKCLVTCVTTDQLEQGLAALRTPPVLIITDSQAFPQVYAKKPAESRLTSFSVLFAALKGDADYFTQSARTVDSLTGQSRVLIAEACTHAPLSEDIGREKIPRLLRKRAGEGLQIDFVSGTDFPRDLRSYDLVIHCGGCMFNRNYVLSRVEQAKSQSVPMSNYGIVLAYLSGILDQIDQYGLDSRGIKEK